MKFKPNQTRTYDGEGFKRRAACLCFKNEKEDEVSCVCRRLDSVVKLVVVVVIYYHFIFWQSPNTTRKLWLPIMQCPLTAVIYIKQAVFQFNVAWESVFRCLMPLGHVLGRVNITWLKGQIIHLLNICGGVLQAGTHWDQESFFISCSMRNPDNS